ncbi:DNA-3-methyladenine glycosylase [Siminovitchia acidinfaciens]|uniref:Putative 3-methyladenine DNA glycosylase n=1 Tax=Siminovitchia acidinfaciens TaxID=2321395 RepID=A0A429XVP3_9BACI|nr:DNA-3-methyladenine glycosylase [Siminovitchia acidinfaciens]RST72332.1 DNA-3-methyladenine glycosylase [Siminovitchia acidinfaciens]
MNDYGAGVGTLYKIEPLNKGFFQQPTIELAQSLLGCLLVKETRDGVSAGYIVETEAYKGPDDRAAHSYGNRRTKRTEVMFGKAGVVYTYTMHTHCLINVVSAGINEPEAVLIRALEPYAGIELMKQRRPIDKMKNLTNGPGKLTKAMGITMEDYGLKFFERPLFISEGYTPEDIARGPRIGIPNTGEAREYPWRFWVKGNEFVSR